MVGRFGRGGLVKSVFKGIGQGLMDGGVGGGNILRNVAEEIVTGGSGPGQTSRAVPGTLDFSDALDQDIPAVTPDPVSTETNFNNFGNWNAPAPPPIPFPENPTAPRPNKRKCGCKKRPPAKRPNERPFAPLFPGPSFPSPLPPDETGDGGDANMGGTWPDPVPANPNINYGYPIGPQVGPNAVAPSGGCGGSCSCRRKYTCEEKCAYNAQMKEQCKGCKSYFRKTKQWVRPKRRYYRRKRTYRRKRKSSGLSLKRLSKYTKKPILNEDKCFALRKKLGSGKKLTKAEADYIQNCIRQGRIAI